MSAERFDGAFPRGAAARLFCAAALLSLAGCSDPLSTQYGHRSGIFSDSVNGTSVFSQLCKQRGHKVRSWRWLSPWLHRQADVIVWAPDDFEPPSDEVCAWLDDWLDSGFERTLIYIGRDYDAAPGYWEKMQPGAPQDLTRELKRLLSEARTGFQVRRLSGEDEFESDWFRVAPSVDRRPVRSLDGAAEWLAGIDAGKLEIEIGAKMILNEEAEPLLTCDGDVLVARDAVEWGQRILVVNGSFLLNLPLVNKEHRKLAGRLIDEMGPPRRVVFLESGPNGPPIREKDPAEEGIGLQLFGTPPFSWLLLHLAGLAIVYGFWRFPIFGTPRREEAAHLTDFGQHVEAVGQLMERTGDVQYAVLRWRQYRQTFHGEAPSRPAASASGAAPRAVSSSATSDPPRS